MRNFLERINNKKIKIFSDLAIGGEGWCDQLINEKDIIPVHELKISLEKPIIEPRISEYLASGMKEDILRIATFYLMHQDTQVFIFGGGLVNCLLRDTLKSPTLDIMIVPEDYYLTQHYLDCLKSWAGRVGNPFNDQKRRFEIYQNPINNIDNGTHRIINHYSIKRVSPLKRKPIELVIMKQAHFEEGLEKGLDINYTKDY